MIDIHAHINLNKKYLRHSEVTTEDFFKNYLKNNLKASVIMINPAPSDICCELGHFVQHKAKQNNEMFVQCTVCDKITYEGIDPYHDENIKMLELCYNRKENLLPFVCLSMANSTIKNEINFFETNFKDKFVGWKLHPSLCNCCLDDCIFDSKRPIIIHTATREPATAKHAIQFAKNYSGNVLLCHAASLDYSVLEAAKNMKNIFFDVCPLGTLIQKFGEKDLLEFVRSMPKDRLLFGSDVPWGETESEMKLFLNLIKVIGIDKDTIYNNTLTFLGKSNINLLK